MASDALIVFVTAASMEQASAIADSLVGERLAACVNILGAIESVYRWDGKVTRDHEVLLIVKTTASRYQELEARIKALHTYTTPEIIAINVVEGSPSYLEWLREAVLKAN